ncbi:uncharacterized protein LDX57_004589 [Aspergillus melleus]|uniref:uncharacterized protein n=1 Tax=Aspergillus melleus TaxID=138277 RepID=UPI001E8CA07D|nr:uncharacterized protein LDX57_004589 [Aspergillus melleus]KAH8426862.1 hypothetical protein LDX57_004589 [Aspergillus melleus]
MKENFPQIVSRFWFQCRTIDLEDIKPFRVIREKRFSKEMPSSIGAVVDDKVGVGREVNRFDSDPDIGCIPALRSNPKMQCAEVCVFLGLVPHSPRSKFDHGTWSPTWDYIP